MIVYLALPRPGFFLSGGRLLRQRSRLADARQRSTPPVRALAESQKCVKPTHAIAVEERHRTPLASTPFIHTPPPQMSAPSAPQRSVPLISPTRRNILGLAGKIVE
jgi:hypothetical protein